MRVISGSARGHKLSTCVGQEVRPTSDRVKEAVFNIIKDSIIGSSFLDLFSGSGAIGIEALSRGAKNCVFIDSSSSSCDIIKKNIAHVEKALDECSYKVLEKNALEAIIKFSEEKIKFDIIFIDPPYHFHMTKDIIDNILENNILKSEGFIIVEHDKNMLDILEKSFNVLKSKKYGKTYITIIKTLEEA